MQGYILKVAKAKNEDTLVWIITSSKLYTLYRFYGSRHSTINVGYKIDFEIEYSIGYLPRLRNITHLGYSWLKSFEKALLWQQFMQLLYDHLKDIKEVDSFYFDLLEEAAKKFHRQNPKRVLIESFVKLLHFEGRLHSSLECFICEKPIQEDPALARAFLPAHSACITKEPFEKRALLHLFTYYDGQFFDDEAIERLWNILLEGM